jgi:hypothetical protein
LQIFGMVQSSLEIKVPPLNFSPIICHIRDLDVWSRGKLCKVSDGTRVVGKCLRNF